MGILLIVCPLLVFSAQALAQAWLRAWLIKSIKSQCDCRVSIGAVEISFLQSAVRIHDVRVESGARGPDGQAAIIFDLTTLDAKPSWRALARGRVDTDLTVNSPGITLLSPDQAAIETPRFVSWSEGFRFDTDIHVRRLIVHDGVVVWRQHDPASTMRITSIEVDASDLGNHPEDAGPIRATAVVTGDGEAEIAGTIDLFAPHASADLGIILRGLRLEAFDPLWRQAMGIQVQHGRLDAYVSLGLNDGVLSGFIKPLVSDLDLSDVSDNLRRYGLASAISSSATSAAWRLLENRHGNITTRVPIEARLDEPGGNVAIASAVRTALIEATRRIPVLEVRLGLTAWTDREWRLALDALRVHDQVWRYGLGFATRRDEQRTSMTLEAVGGPGMDVGRVRIELLPRLGVGGARDHDDTGFTLAYGASLDATFPVGPAVVGARVGWDAEETFGGAKNVSGAMAGLTLGWRF